MPTFEPYEHILKNFSRHKFKLFIEESILNPKSYGKDTSHSDYWKVHKESWEKSDLAYIDIPVMDVMFNERPWSYTRWLFFLDHIESGLIIPEMCLEKVRHDILRKANDLSKNRGYIKNLGEALVGKNPEMTLNFGNGIIQKPLFGTFTLYYLTNINFKASQDFYSSLSSDVETIFVKSGQRYGMPLDRAHFSAGIGNPTSFLELERDRSIKIVNEIESRPDSIELQFLDGKLEVLGSNKRKVWAYDCDKTKLVSLDQVIDSNRYFAEDEIDDFENLLNKPHLREEELQRFFSDRPKFLLALDYDEIKPHISLIDESESELIPDFFLRPINKEYWEILDLKLPSAKLIAGSANRKRLSHHVSEGIAQLMNYAKYFDNPQNQEKVQRLTGIKCFKPRLTLVIGKRENVDEASWNQIIEQERPFVNILTYDDLLAKIRRNILRFEKDQK